MLSFHFVLVSLFLHGLYRSTAGEIIPGLSELKTEDGPYDFVIAGGGTAGLVLANRLSEDPKIKVLVIEAGPSNEDILDLQVPFFAYKLGGDVSPYAWNTTTTPQKGLLGRSITYYRGFVLGGSSSHNNMFWVRGTREDYDKWANVTHDHGWSWDSLLPYMKKVEKWSPSSETPGFDQGKFDPAVHGFDGPLGVGITGLLDPVDNLMVQVLESKEFNLTMVDANAGDSLGYWWLQSSIAHGTRTSSATAYLEPIQDRPNLTVLINTHVTRILQTKKGVFTTLEAAESATGLRKTFVAKKEIILSAGVIGTPQILLNSGIGDSNELKAVGVASTHELPDVGKGLSNEPQNVFQWKANTTIPDLINNATLAQEQLDLWKFNRTGLLLTLAGTILSFHRLPKNSPLLQNIEDPTAGPNTPHYWLAATANPYFSTGSNPLVTVFSPVAEPSSRGSVTLKSNNPFDQPNVDLGFYNTDLDIGIALQSFKTAEAQMTHPIMSGFTMDRFAPPLTATTDEDIVTFIRNTTSAASHGVGTAAMSATSSKTGVVNPDLKVKGIQGVRVVDASVIPFSPQANTQASVYIVAERASDIIKEDWKI